MPSTSLVDTTVGRALLSEILPKGLPFSVMNKALKKKEISKLINVSFRRCGLKETVVFADKLLQNGFRLATRAGISIAIDDMLVPQEKYGIISRAEDEVKEIANQYASGLVTAGERYNKVVDIWGKAGDEVSKVMMAQLAKEKTTDRHGKEVEQESFNSIYMMADSGARGSAAQIRQLAGMRGLMAKPDGSIIETPITANFREGLNVLQYFISTHGARKGLADTALKTANSGYLTRRLVDVTQDLVIKEDDCGTHDGQYMRAIVEGGEVLESLRERILGRSAAEGVLRRAVGRDQFGLLGPGPAAARVHVGRAPERHVVDRLVWRPDQHGVARNRDCEPEEIAVSGIAGHELGLDHPSAGLAHEHIGRAMEPVRAETVPGHAHDGAVAVDRDRGAEGVAAGAIGAQAFRAAIVEAAQGLEGHARRIRRGPRSQGKRPRQHQAGGESGPRDGGQECIREARHGIQLIGNRS